MRQNISRKNLNPKFDIRRSQLLSTYGIGSIVEVENQALMIADSEFWNTDSCEVVHDIRLERVMQSKGFIEPPVSSEDSISTVRFPTWYFSQGSRQLKKIDQWKSLIGARSPKAFDNQPYDATRGNCLLIPVGLVCICKNGHAQDFPWLEWAHKGKVSNDLIHKLKLKNSNNTGSISNMYVECTTCKIRQHLTKIFSKNEFPEIIKKYNVHCSGTNTWQQNRHHESCEAILEVVLRTASNFYFPNISSSVNIPFSDDNNITLIKNNPNYQALQANFSDEQIAQLLIKKISESTNIPENEVLRLVEKENSDENEELSSDEMEYRRAEYEVLKFIREYDEADGKLSIQQISSNKLTGENINLFDNVTLVHQLEVVNVLRSYSRVSSSENTSMTENSDSNDVFKSSKEVSLKRKDEKYVGMRFLGEGIFLSFDNRSINEWLLEFQDLPEFQNIMRKNTDFVDKEKYISPKYYMLHTFSHLLINELSEKSGYSSSAIKERIYFSEDPSTEMYGVLIYTSSSDSEGTLGGLVKQGVIDNLSEIIESLLSRAKWCSYDPVCIETDSQGKESLNAAACHACALISETSCENMNSFLDRRMVIGTPQNNKMGFFKS